jgi:hypothetical protein
MGMVPALAAFALLSRNRKVVIFILMLFLSFILLVILGPPILEKRVLGTFRPEATQKLKQVGPVTLGPSPAARVASWNEVFTRDFPKKPLVGGGVTGGPFLDSQYVLILQENGLIGICLFFWLMWRVWRSALGVYNTVEDPLFKGLAFGYLVGFVGLLVQAIGTNTFIIIRIAEPFWFFTAVVMKLRDIETEKALEEKPLSIVSRKTGLI